MAQQRKERAIKDLYESIFMAIDEYASRHKGAGPARLTMTHQAIGMLSETTYLRCDISRQYYFCGMPVDPIPGDGCHVYFTEPEINIYMFSPGQQPQAYTRPDNMEGQE